MLPKCLNTAYDAVRNETGRENPSYAAILQRFVFDHDRNEKIRCIKTVRELTGAGLREAKDYCESVWAVGMTIIVPPMPIPGASGLPTIVYRDAPKPAPKTYDEARAPILAARKAFLAAVNEMIADPLSDQWMKDDIIRDMKDDLGTVQSYFNLLTA